MTNECNASLFSALICSLLSPRSYCWSLTPQSIISPNIVIILGADSSYKVAISSISLATAIIAIRIFFIFLVAPTAFNCSTCFGILYLMNKNMSEESHKKIFISHSSKDKQIVDIFVDKLLHLGLQIDPNDVAYTSREETGVGTGEDIRKFIKENISTCDFVFFMISENYKKSEICLNEMGAAWATDRTVIPLVFPNLSFDSIGWLYNVRKA